MATQIIMDHNGDTRHNFDAKDVKALLEAERRFKALTGAGFTAATRAASGEPGVTGSFDPTVEETLFFRGLSAAKTWAELVTLLHDASGQLRRLPATCLQLARAFREWCLRPSTREQRGLKLLREWLSQEQLAQYDAHRYFEVVGCHSGKRYRIHHGIGANVIELDNAS